MKISTASESEEGLKSRGANPFPGNPDKLVLN